MPTECTPRKTTKPTINTAILPPLYFLPRSLRLGLLAARLRPPAAALRGAGFARGAGLARGAGFARDIGFARADRFDGLAALRDTARLTDRAVFFAATACLVRRRLAGSTAACGAPRKCSRMAGFSRVDTSWVISSPRAMERSKRRMLFPERVF